MKLALVNIRVLNQISFVGRQYHFGSKLSGYCQPLLRFNRNHNVRAFSAQIQDPKIPVHHLAMNHLDRVAIHDNIGSYTYKDVLLKSTALSKKIMEFYNGSDKQERIGFLCSNDVTYVIAQWACWASGNIAVPLSPHHPPALLSYYLQDCEASLVIATENHRDLLNKVVDSTGLPTIILEEKECRSDDPTPNEFKAMPFDSIIGKYIKPVDYYSKKNALILYTSGTTGKPKGVLLSHDNIDTQVQMLVEMWKWTPKDVIVHALPLNHTHGVINALLCPLYVGARCIMIPKFDGKEIWSKFLDSTANLEERPTVFMGVPTMYSKLLESYETLYGSNLQMVEYVRAICSSNFRVMISGSAALPEPVFHRWTNATGLQIVERYGMTEIGSVLSIPLEGERRPGYVGIPSPGVSIRIAEFHPSPAGTKGIYTTLLEATSDSTQNFSSKSCVVGDLLVKGPNVFQGYWNRPEATSKDFTHDGWFRTGDVVQHFDGYFKILGRSSADIIKSGGFKISALEIETHLLAHPDIVDCTVVGIPDITWGQRVAAALVLAGGKSETDLQALKLWCKQRMAHYMVPTEWRIYSTLPRNALGKVNKIEFVKTAFPNVRQ